MTKILFTSGVESIGSHVVELFFVKGFDILAVAYLKDKERIV